MQLLFWVLVVDTGLKLRSALLLGFMLHRAMARTFSAPGPCNAADLELFPAGVAACRSTGLSYTSQATLLGW